MGVSETAVIIAAAGSSHRMGAGLPKQYRIVEALPVLIKTVKAFCHCGKFAQIIIAAPPGDTDYVSSLLAEYGVEGCAVTAGGTTRPESVMNALALVDARYVMVHDGARPFVSAEVIGRVQQALDEGARAVIPCVRPKNTIRTADATLDRSALYEVQTPQGFETEVLRKAYEKAFAEGFAATDEAGVTEHCGIRTQIVEGSYDNIKITTPDDLPKEAEPVRTGFGYDVHRLVPGRPLMIGCVHVPYEKGLLGHSDADVLSHALADALLGAAALGDIGQHFPDSSAETEGMPGRVLLAKTAELLREAGFTIINADATLVAERPKVAAFKPAMQQAVAEALGVEASQIGIKATTEEGLGITGSGEAMAAYAAANIIKTR